MEEAMQGLRSANPADSQQELSYLREEKRQLRESELLLLRSLMLESRQEAITQASLWLTFAGSPSGRGQKREMAGGSWGVSHSL